MGRRSKEMLLCKVVLGITNGPIFNHVMRQIDAADVPFIVKNKTYGCCKIVDIKKDYNGGILSTDVTITYKLEMDMYCIIKKKTNKIISQVMKRFKSIRRRLVMKELKKEMERNFNNKIRDNAGGFAGMVATVKSVEVTREY